VTQGNGEPSIPDDQPPGLDYLGQLIVAAARGEHSAFDTLFRQLSGPVYRMALAVTRNPAQAEEVSQEVLIDIWRTAGRFDPAKGSAMAWALTIARRRAIDRVRSTAADAHRERRNTAVPVSWDQASETVEEILDRERLVSSLNRLSVPQRQVIMLAFFGGHSYNEVAAILGVAAGTVKGRIRAALDKLRDHMHAVG